MDVPLLQPEHKVATRFLQPALSLTLDSASLQVIPISPRSAYFVLSQVVFGLPRGLFPYGVHRRAILVSLLPCILRTCPSHHSVSSLFQVDPCLRFDVPKGFCRFAGGSHDGSFIVPSWQISWHSNINCHTERLFWHYCWIVLFW